MILTPATQIKEYTQQGWWGNTTLSDLFLKNVRATPQAIALVDPPNRSEIANDEPQRFTYTQLQNAVDRLAVGLIKQGLRQNDLVLIQLPNTVELVITYLACARLGIIASPLPVQYRTHEIKQVLSILEKPKAFITTTNFSGFNYVEMVKSLQTDCASLQTIIATGTNIPADTIAFTDLLAAPAEPQTLDSYLQQNTWSANDLFTICWTSGTETEPKGVPRSHNLWITIAYATVDGAQIEHGANLLNPFPLVNMSGIGGMLVPWLLTGGKLTMHHPLNLTVFLSQIKTEAISYTVVPPVLLNMLLHNNAIMEKADLSTLKNIGSGSAPLSPWMVSTWKEKYNKDILNVFGSNEGCAFIGVPQEIPHPAERARFFPRYGTPEFKSQNRATFGMQTKLIDPITKEIITEPEMPGELLIKGPTIFSGYYNRPEINKRSFDHAGFFQTGDLFEIAPDEEGHLNRYRFVGRLKDLIIRGGMKIAPEELEALLLEHPKIAEVAVFGIPDPKLNDEKICVVAVPKKDQTVELSDLQEFLHGKDIAHYKMPKKLITLQSLPRNPVGKVLKRDLKQQHAEA